MMLGSKTGRDVPGVIAPPPLIVLFSICIGAILAAFVPILLPSGLRLPGAALLVAGVGLAIWAERRFHAVGTPAPPWKESRALALDGPFRFTRNPMYVGMVLFQAGLALALRDGWMLLLSVASLAMLHYGVVLREELYLRRKFGAEYEALLARTRRWL
jgi:protein-S-isoprenylcysteine O-methyltransferase Ste14